MGLLNRILIISVIQQSGVIVTLQECNLLDSNVGLVTRYPL
jgi:hypothetical protein